MGTCRDENRLGPEVRRRPARGWKICWMRKDQESWGCPAREEEAGGRPEVSQGRLQLSSAASGQALGAAWALGQGHLANFLPD